MKYFAAHLHPLLVHLPIGILLLATVFAWMGRCKRYATLLEAVPVLIRLGTLAGLLSCGSGWLLSSSGEYDSSTLQWHQWLGLATTAVAFIACFVPNRLVLSSFMAVLVIATGHLGGTMTHGTGYLSLPGFGAAPVVQRPKNVQDALVYQDVVALILQEKCTSCHGSTKQKGGLRLDQPEALQKGGRNGPVLKPGNPNDSELLRRCLLPLSHEDHMPPKEKAQLSTAEIEILRWWLSQGADFQKKTNELPQTAMLQTALTIWVNAGQSTVPLKPDVPLTNPPAAPALALKQLRQAGVLVQPVSQESQWLYVNFVNLPHPPDSIFPWLEQLSTQTVWLKMSYCQLPPEAWNVIGKMSQLTRLSLDHSNVNDTAMSSLNNLHHLQSLNLAHTQVSGQGLGQLLGLLDLKTLYLYKTAVKNEDFMHLKAVFPKTALDTGGYGLPFLETDTARVDG